MKFPKNEMIVEHHFADAVVEIGDDLPKGLLSCTLERCRVVISVKAGGPSIYRSRLIDCTIEVKRKMRDTRLPKFFDSDYVRCKFKGHFSGVDFGRSPWPDPLTGELDKHGDLIDCDFTEATLDLCRFFNVDITRQKFAPWPQFVISMEQYRKAAAMERGWPGKLGIHISGRLKENPQLSAVTGTKSDFMKRYAVTEEELEQSLQAMDGVIR